MKTMLVGQFKGGVGKTLIAHHVCELAAEYGLKVLAVDTDRQGDLYRRLSRVPGKHLERPPLQWAPDCAVLWSPENYALTPATLKAFGLAVVDTSPNHMPPPGVPDMLVVPVDGLDALINASETVAEMLKRDVRKIVLIDNGMSEGGKRYAEEFNDMAEGLPSQVVVCPVKLLRGGSVKRTSQSLRPAWNDPTRGKDAWAIQDLCKWLLNEVKA